MGVLSPSLFAQLLDFYRARPLWEFYRTHYPFACWISIALVIHSFDPIRSLDLFASLIARLG